TYAVTDGHGGTLSDQTRGITLAAVNDAPTGAPTATLAAGAEDTPYIIHASDLLVGFSDADSDTLSVSGLS
ncbi:cadherin-like domain-containing protein, partial [Xanthobacter sp. V0B-10]|uniref:cadherin-like domain-containing protein n=1 Tax=Xanthobacter albus TaxID=3119929 RepID=UPI003729AD0B